MALINYINESHINPQLISYLYKRISYFVIVIEIITINLQDGNKSELFLTNSVLFSWFYNWLLTHMIIVVRNPNFKTTTQYWIILQNQKNFGWGMYAIFGLNFVWILCMKWYATHVLTTFKDKLLHLTIASNLPCALARIKQQPINVTSVYLDHPDFISNPG